MRKKTLCVSSTNGLVIIKFRIAFIINIKKHTCHIYTDFYFMDISLNISIQIYKYIRDIDQELIKKSIFCIEHYSNMSNKFLFILHTTICNTLHCIYMLCTFSNYISIYTYSSCIEEIIVKIYITRTRDE